ncbi:MAG: Mur ligase family protein, partial [Patescibacteria group bacterium]
MEIKDLQNKLVAVLGFGLEGEATTKYLLDHGVSPTLFDQKPWDLWPKDAQEKIKLLGINFIFGPDCFKELATFDVAFRSPGVSLYNLSMAIPSSNFAKASSDLRKGEGKLQITSQTKWFFEHCPAKIIGVTGTKGKGTTASLIYEMFSMSLRVHPKQSHELKGLPRLSDAFEARNDKGLVYLTGNIGKVQPLEFLDNLTADDWVVYELSSFQLQDLQQSPHIGVVLMTTSEHLDYHQDESEYVEAKSAIVKYQTTDDVAIINADYKNSGQIGQLGHGKKLFFSRQTTQGDCYVENNILVLKNSDFQFNLN